MIHQTAHRQKQALRYTLVYAVLIVLAAAFLFPIIWSTLNSFKPPSEAMAVPPTYLPTTFSLDNYIKLTTYGRGGIFRHVFNSAFVSVLTVLGTIVLSTLGGYGFARFSFPGKGVLFIMVLSTLMIPFQSILIPLFVMLAAVDLHNNLFGLVLVYITFQLPFGIFLMRTTFMTIPREIEESALLDGCTSLSVLYRMLLRLVMPGIVTVAIYAFINSWDEFIAALIFMTDQSNFTLPIFLTTVRSGQYGQVDWGALQAGVVISIIPSLVIFLVLQRYYMSGLMGGAVKS